MLRYLLFYSFFPAVLLAGVPEIRNVTVKQRFPWNKIEISYNVIGNVAAGLPEWQKPFLSLSALDRMTGSNYVSQASAIFGDTGTEEGAHRIVWDLNAQGVQIKSDDVVFTVAYSCPKYCIIDLSAGTNATSYPISYLSDVPAGGWTDEHKTTKLVLRLIEPGSLRMNGSYDVTLTQPFYIGVFEVTQKQYELVTGNNPSSYKGDTRPVEYASWNTIRGNSDSHNWPNVKTVDPKSFVGLLRSKTGLSLDLPTEAQWEYACRAGTTSSYNNGGNAEADLKTLGRYSGNQNDGRGGCSQHTTVGSYAPNAWGLYDMHGNVWEWCLDWYGSLSNGTNPLGLVSGSIRVMRGGSWSNVADDCTSSHRHYSIPVWFTNDYGFRLGCSAGLAYSSTPLATSIVNADNNGDVVYSNLSEPVKINAQNGQMVDSIEISYDSSWVGGDTNAIVVVRDNGTEIKRTTGVGEFVWSPTTPGKHTLTYTTCINGILQEEMYTATVFKDWKYTVEGGNATIVATTQTSGNVTIPSEIDGYPVAAVNENTFRGCTGLKNVTLPLAIFKGNVAQVEKNSWTEGEDGVYQSNDINDSESTSMTLEVEGPCDFTFDWKVSSERNYDKLKWYLDGLQISEISGSGNGWQTVSYSIPEGSHTIRWEYSKDGSVSNGDDCGWVRFTESVSASMTMSNLFPDSYTAITNVVLTGEGEKIPAGAFAGCASLQNVEIPESATQIGIGAFTGCAALSDEDGFLIIRDVLYGYFGENSKVTIPNGVTDIAPQAFYGCDALAEVIIPDSVVNIGGEAFASCISLMSVVIPNSVTRIEEGVFNGCESITNMVLPFVGASRGYVHDTEKEAKEALFGHIFGSAESGTSSVRQEIHVGHWSGSYSGTSYTYNGVPDSLKSVTITDETVIGYGAFSGCSHLESVVIAGRGVWLEEAAFSGCSNLRNLELPNGTSYSWGVFLGCGALRRVAIPQAFCTDEFSEIFPNAWNKITDLVIQDGTTRIDEWAFEGCAFRNVILPSTLERIDEGAFGSCSSITNIVIPASVKEIGHYAFEACVGLPAFVVDEKNEYYKSVNGVLFSKDGKTLLYCPAGSDFASYEIPSEVEEVWDGAFAYCSNLSAITVASGNGHFKSNGGVLFSADGTRLVQYPAGKIGPYLIPEGTIELAEFAFGGCGGLSEITFPKSLTEIACAAFMDCTGLRAVDIPDWVKWIGDSAFEWCTSLEYVGIPGGVEYIGDDERAFNNCGSIKKIVIAQYVLWRGVSEVFPHSYGNIQEIVIIGDVDSAWGSFWGCNALTRVVIDESVGSIADWSEYVPLVVFEGRAPDGLTESGLLDCAERIQYKREYADGFDSIVDDEKFMGFPVDYDSGLLFADLSFRTGRGAEWSKDTVETLGGNPSLKSGKPDHGGTSWVETVITGKGKGSFVWKVSSEHYDVDIYDYARFIVDGVTAVEIFGGVQDWAEVTFEFADIGPHTLRWEYVKDSEDDPELEPVDDCVWVSGFSWVPKYNVSFDVGDVESNIPAEIPAHVDEVVILPEAISDPDGQYVFNGWSDGKNTYSAGSEYVVPNGDAVLTAIWLRKINVSFDLSGAIGDVPVQIRELGGRVVKLPVTDGITKEDHVFAGWSDGVNTYEAGADYIVPEDDVVLIALWSKKTFISFVTPDDDVLGDLPEMAKILPGGKLLLPASDGISRSCYTFVGWSDGETVYEAGTEYVVHEADVTFSPVWRANTLLAPVISSADVLDGGVHDKESATVDIRAESGATIYYTLDGTEPSTNSICYEKSFAVDTLRGNVKAIAVKENHFNSDIAEFSFTRLPWSLGECVNSEMLNVTTGGDVGWHRVLAGESHDGTAGLRSGEISEGGSSWVEVEVRGRGTISFWWKTSSERTVKGKRHDGCVVSIDGSEIAYMDHTTNEWTYVEYYIESKGPHVVRWTYQKDANGLTSGEDCAWVDAVGWSAIIPITRSIVYENLMGAENSNPDRYAEGDAVTFLPPSDVDNYTFTGWMPSAITESDTGDKVVTANWEWTPQDAVVDASITGRKPVTVKADWVKTELEQKFGAGKKESFITRFGDNLTSAMTKKTGKRDGAGNDLLVWHDYVAGTDPTDINSTFKAMIEMQDGKPVISWEPDLNSAGEERVYTVHGKESLSDVWHSPIAALDHFFKVDVAMPRVGTVTFNVGGGSSVSPISVRVGQPLGELPTPTRVGYTFLGWFTAQEGGEAVMPETIVTADTTIYARWELFDIHGKVQLWKGGPYWATTNIGAENPEDYGYYFWWGDTVGYKREGIAWVASDGSSSNFSFSTGNTPTYNKSTSTLQSEGWITSDGVLASEHDAAQIHWGGNWRMPTKAELENLNTKCSWTWATTNGVNGYIVRGKDEFASASIFLPAAGNAYEASLGGARSDGYYWSSVPYSDNDRAWGLYFNSGSHGAGRGDRYIGKAVRAVQGFTK